MGEGISHMNGVLRCFLNIKSEFARTKTDKFLPVCDVSAVRVGNALIIWGCINLNDLESVL